MNNEDIKQKIYKAIELINHEKALVNIYHFVLRMLIKF